MTPYRGEPPAQLGVVRHPQLIQMPGWATLDLRTRREVSAILTLRSVGFLHCDTTRDEVFLRRFAGDFVDLASLIISGMDKESGVIRYERRTFPWPKDETPEPIRIATGSIEDLVRQVLEWPRT